MTANESLVAKRLLDVDYTMFTQFARDMAGIKARFEEDSMDSSVTSCLEIKRHLDTGWEVEPAPVIQRELT